MIYTLVKYYFRQYSGIPKSSWERVIVLLLNSLAGGVLFFLSFYFVHILHLDIQSAGFIMACYGIGTIAGGLIGGKLTDKIGPGMVSIVSLFLRAVGFLILMKITQKYSLMLNVFILGLTNYSFLTSNKIEALRHCKDEEDKKNRVLAILYAFTNLGIGLSAFIMGWLGNSSFHLVFFCATILLLLAVAYLIFLELKSKSISETTSEDETDEIEPQVIKTNKIAIYTALTCLFLIGLIIAQRTSTYSLFLHEAFPHLGLHWMGLLFMINPIMILFLQTPLSNYLKQHNKFLLIGIGIFLYGSGACMLSFSSLYALAIISCIILTFGEMLSLVNIQYICYKNSVRKKKGASIGLYQSVYAVSVTIGFAAGGVIYHHLGGSVIWYISGLIGFVCLGICLYANKRIAY